MRNGFSANGVSAGNPIANVLVVIVGTLAIAASVVLGFVAFVVVGSLVLVLGSIIAIRVWWLQRKLKRRAASAPSTQTNEGGVIEGEYRVVADEDKGE